MKSMIRFLKISVVSTVMFFCALTQVNAQAGNALSFDGVNDYVDAGGVTEFNLTGDVTVETWFFINAMPADDWVRIVGKSGPGISDPRTFGLWYHANGTVLFQNSNNAITNPGMITTGRWYHMAGVKSGDALTLYLDGIAVATGWSSSPTSSGPLRVGFAGFHSPHNGQIDEVRIWNVARSQNEIRSAAGTPLVGNETGLVALYHFDEVVTLTTPDATVNNLTGTLINGPYLLSSGAMHPFAPTGLAAVSGVENVLLHWHPNFESNFQYYRVYMGTSPNPTNLVYSTIGGINDTSKTFTGLSNFTTYYFRITAVNNDENESPYSGDISATPSTFVEVQGLPFAQAFNGNFVWGDYDNDGDYDVVIAGSVSGEWSDGPYELGIAKLYRNDLGVFSEISAGFQQQIHRSAAAWCDYNNDGYLDLAYMGSAGNGTRAFKLYKNNGNGTFTDVSTNIAGQAFGSMAWGDYDNDGDQDLLVIGNDGNNDNTFLYRNDGNDAFTAVDIGLPGYSGGSCAWGDYDNDQDLDLLILGNGMVTVYRNDNNDQFTELFGEGPIFQGVQRGQAIWADYDNDGLLDVIYSGARPEGGRYAFVYRNQGGDWFSDIGAGLTGVARATLSVGDYDNDGDLDIFLAGDPGYDYSDATSLIYRNDGDGNFTAIDAGIVPIQGAKIDGYWPHLPSSAFVDFDRDGDLDIMVEGMDANLNPITRLYENQGTVFNTPPFDPTGLVSTPDANSVDLSWVRSTDAETPTDGLTYNLRVGTTPAGIEVMSPMAKVVGSGNAGGFRLVQAMGNTGHNNSWRLNGLADGTYYWSVEAIDQVYRNSKFQTEQSFIIDGPPTAPENVIATAGVNSVILKWNRSQNSSVMRYVIYGGVEPGMTDSLAAATGGTPDTSKTITGLTNGQVYYFTIRAIDPNGYMSNLSDEVSAKPSATPGRLFVTTASYSGPGSLTEAISEANLLSQADTITFQISSGSTITAYSALPAITGDFTVIDGDLNSDGIPDILIKENDGYSNVLTITSSNNVIRGLVIGSDMSTGGGGHAIVISGSNAHDNVIVGNYIGTDLTGMASGTDGYGIRIENGAHHNWIGDGTMAGRNIISANNSDGIYIDGSGASCDHNKFLGNFIGIKADGVSELQNYGAGIHFYFKANYNQIGNATTGGRNIVSGNWGAGIYLQDDYGGHLEGNQILGNYIGTDQTGLTAIGNRGSGIYLEGYNGGGEVTASSVINTQIGNGNNEGMNVISGNGYEVEHGIHIRTHQAYGNTINKNYIGVGSDGVTPLSNASFGIYADQTRLNTISNNIIAQNNVSGIYLYYSTEMTITGNVISGNQNNGIQFYYSSNNTLLGNHIGTDAAGTSAMANSGFGISIEYVSNDNQIGDGTPSGRNIISGNNSGGIRIWNDYNPVSGNKIYGNYIGTDISGNAAIPNSGRGVILEDYATSNEIGGLTPGQGNVISGNFDNAIYIGSSYPTGGGSDWNKVNGNIIGLGADGSTVLSNSGDGIYAEGIVRYMEIMRNIISGNNGHGISIFDNNYDASGHRIIGNFIGTDVDGLADRGNTGSGIQIYGSVGFSAHNILIGDGTDAGKNIISGNDGNGIALEGDAVYGNKIFRNYIGVNLNGQDLGNDLDGVVLKSNTYNDSIIDNVISGNGWHGISIDGSNGHVILGNRLGTNPTGMTAVSNQLGGIVLYDGNGWTFGILIGDGTETGRNIISGNSSHGINMEYVESGNIYDIMINGNYIGKAADGYAALGNDGSGVMMQGFIHDNALNGNAIAHNAGDGVTMDGINVHGIALLANSIFENGGAGVRILNGAQYGVTPATIDSLGADNVLYGTGSNYGDLIQVYVDGSDDEGRNYFGTTLVDEAGYWNIPLNPVIGNHTITVLQNVYGDGEHTSEFSYPLVTAPGLFAPDPSYLNFGDVPVGDSLTMMIEAAVSGNGIITTGGALDFELMFRVASGTEFPDTSFDGEKITGYVQFKPTAFGVFSDTIRFTNNSSVNPLKVYLQGNGVPGDLIASASTIDFGNILVGDSSSQILRIYSNNGPVVLDSAGFKFGDQFSISGIQLPDTLFGGDTVDVNFKFKPTIFSATHDTVRIFNNSLVTPINIALSGIGQAGTLVTTTPVIDFGNVLVGDSAKLKVRVYVSTGIVHVNDATFDFGNKFKVSVVGLPLTLGVGDSLVADITFVPTVFGALSDTLRFSNNSDINPYTITMDGTGAVGTLAASPSALNFGSVLIGDSVIQTFKLYASSGHVLASGGSLDFGSHFFVTSVLALPDSLVRGDTITVAVKFKPSVFGLLHDTIRFVNNTSINPLKVPLSASGAAGTLASSVSSMNFGTVIIGDSAVQNVKLYTSSGSVMVNSSFLSFGTNYSVNVNPALP
ncbi:VCBS repeat-containing protein, partial [bacterium]|nr:VCBS repeat-containing protein [bacterium]